MPKETISFRHPALGRVTGVDSMLAIRWNDGVPKRSRDSLLRTHKLRLLTAEKSTKQQSSLARVNNTDALWWVGQESGRPVSNRTLEELESSDSVQWVSRVFHGESNDADEARFCVNPMTLLLSSAAAQKLGDISTNPEIGAEEFLVSTDNTRQYFSKDFVALRVEQHSSAQGRTATMLAERVLRALAKTGFSAGSTDVILENIPYVSPTCDCGCTPPKSELIPNDPLFANQWSMRRINAPRAWNLTSGDPAVVVAVLDEGVELAHPDLQLYPQSWNASTHLPNGSPTGNHGTACAGIVSGRFDNSLGTTGVAGNCRIMAIATATWADTDVAEGLYFAADNGARVVSMSFGVYPSWNVWNFDLIRAALQYAIDKGLVLIAASGNENMAQSRFPGSDSRTICVGGTNRDDVRKSVGDNSIETFWGASYGADLDVCAPCLEIPTTDRLGTSGYNATVSPNGDYYLRFNGTSSATPHVAGLAGLILSLNPSLQAVQVREIISTSCDKVRPDVYNYALSAAKPYGTWNNEIGYGRINAERALLLACSYGSSKKHGPCGVELPCADKDCVSPKGLPWLPFDQCMSFFEYRNVENRTVDREFVIQFRILFQHCLRLRGRKQGPLVFTLTLLPSEELKLYQFDRYRRVRAIQDAYSVHTSFRQYVSAIAGGRTSSSSSKYQSAILNIRSDGDTNISVGGQLFPLAFDAEDHETEISAGVSASTQQVAEQFHQTLVTASQATESERSIIVSTYEDKEQLNVTSRLIRNENKCRAVTYFVRRVMEVYTLSTRIIRIEYRILGTKGQLISGNWRDISDHSGLNGNMVQALKRALAQLPQLGQKFDIEREITIPTDGTLYEAELAHCCSCEPEREAAHLIELERAKAEARKLCLESELLELEKRRREALLAASKLEPFEVAALPPSP